MKMNELTDGQLMAAYLQDNSEAFEELYARYFSKVISYLRKYLTEDDVHDLAQKIWLKLHLKRGLFQCDKPFAPWFFVLIRHTLIDHWRQLPPHQVPFLDEHLAVENTFDQAILWQQIYQALGPKERPLFDRRMVEGLTFKELARELELTEAQGRKRISRLLAKLKNIFADKEDCHE